MHQSSAIEISTGMFVLLGFAALFFLVTQITSREFALTGGESYHLQARFENIGGLKVGAPVSMGGVTVGRVEAIGLDQEDYTAVVSLRIDARYDRIPNDTDATIYTAGLLGGQYVGLTAGGSPEYFADGDVIEITQGALVLENLIGQFLANMAGKKTEEDAVSEE